MPAALVVLVVGVLLCFFGIRSVNLALLAAGFALGFLVAEAFDADSWTRLWVGLGAAALVWMVVSLVFRFATFVVGLATGAVIGAKLWSALSDPGTSALLGIVLVVTCAYTAALLAEKYARRALLWFTALGGASVILSGAALLWTDGFGFLAAPDEGWQQTVMLVVWLAVAGSGWYVQRQLFRERLGLPPKPAKTAKPAATSSPSPARPAATAPPAAPPKSGATSSAPTATPAATAPPAAPTERRPAPPAAPPERRPAPPAAPPERRPAPSTAPAERGPAPSPPTSSSEPG